jgi:protein-S-isoprenylcysteine O-methyltransferase Ste14
MKRKDIFYVSIQSILFFVYLLLPNYFSFEINLGLRNASLILACIGAIILLLAILQLNRNLSPFPTPKSNSVLIISGLYKYVRHPIYTGIIIFAFSYGVYSQHMWRLFIAIILVVLFYFKSGYEESLLQEKFKDYVAYKKSKGRFFPFL